MQKKIQYLELQKSHANKRTYSDVSDQDDHFLPLK